MVLGWMEHDRAGIKDVSLQMLGVGRALAAELGTSFVAALIGEDLESRVSELSEQGLGNVLTVRHPEMGAYAPDAWAESLAQYLQLKSPAVVMAMGTDRGNEVLARLAARLDAPFAANCVEIQPGEEFVVKRVRWGGSLFEEAVLPGSEATVLLTVAPHVFPAEPRSPADSAQIEVFEPKLEETHFRVRVSGYVDPGEAISLADARVVVGGGRGVGSQEGFEVLEDLAEILGGVVGGSRVATNLGWRPHSDQIGQTGTRVAPDLYIACGISGAIQHWVGCMGSKKILAINTDPEAPMVMKADYAVIGDLHEVVPAICAELKKRG